MNWTSEDDRFGTPIENVRCQKCLRRCLIPGCECNDAKPFLCVHCASTGREPIPFSEMWGVFDE